MMKTCYAQSLFCVCPGSCDSWCLIISASCEAFGANLVTALGPSLNPLPLLERNQSLSAALVFHLACTSVIVALLTLCPSPICSLQSLLFNCYITNSWHIAQKQCTTNERNRVNQNLQVLIQCWLWRKRTAAGSHLHLQRRGETSHKDSWHTTT